MFLAIYKAYEYGLIFSIGAFISFIFIDIRKFSHIFCKNICVKIVQNRESQKIDEFNFSENLICERDGIFLYISHVKTTGHRGVRRDFSSTFSPNDKMGKLPLNFSCVNYVKFSWGICTVLKHSSSRILKSYIFSALFSC